MPKPISLTKDWRQWVWQIEKHKLTLQDVEESIRSRPDGRDYRRAFQQAMQVSGALRDEHVTPATPMNYSTQLIVLLDTTLEREAKLLHEKRETAGDSGKSHILYFNKGGVRLHPADSLPVLDAQSRVYVVGHGDAGSTVVTRTGANTTEQWDPKTLAEQLRAVIKKFGADRVKRISLYMCFGGGNPQGRDPLGPTPVKRVGSTESYAARLYELLKDVTNEVAGRAESMSMETERYGFDGGPQVEMGMRKVTGADRQHQGTGRKVVFSAQNDPAKQTARSYEWGH